jgi:hypothetical protein
MCPNPVANAHSSIPIGANLDLLNQPKEGQMSLTYAPDKVGHRVALCVDFTIVRPPARVTAR